MEIVDFILSELEACRNDGQKRVTLPGGTHIISPETLSSRLCFISNHDSGLKRILFDLSGVNGVTIEGNGTELIFQGRIIPFLLNGAEDIAIENLTIDWERPFISQGKILNSGDGFVDLHFSEEYPFAVQDGVLHFAGAHFDSTYIQNLVEFDREQRKPAADARDNPGLRKGVRTEDLGNRKVRLWANFAEENRFVQGNIVVIKHERRESPGFILIDSRNIRLSDITIYHAGGMGVIGQNSRDIFIHRLDVVPRPGSGRVFSSFVDATHFVDCRGKLELSDCRMEGQMDDACNVHGIFLRICQQPDSRRIRIRLMHPQQAGVRTLFAGDLLAVFDDQTMEQLQTIPVQDVRVLNETMLELTLAEALSVAVPLDRLVVMRENHDLEVLIQRCVFKNNRARGLLLNAFGKIKVDNCYFHNSMSGVFCGGAFEGDWYESGPAEDIEITNCTFDRCGYMSRDEVIRIDPTVRSGTIPYHHNIRIHHNRFVAEGTGILSAHHVSEFEFTDNEIIYEESGEPLVLGPAMEAPVIEGNGLKGVDL